MAWQAYTHTGKGRGPQDKLAAVFIADPTTLLLLFLAPAWNVKGRGERFSARVSRSWLQLFCRHQTLVKGSSGLPPVDRLLQFLVDSSGDGVEAVRCANCDLECSKQVRKQKAVGAQHLQHVQQELGTFTPK